MEEEAQCAMGEAKIGGTKKAQLEEHSLDSFGRVAGDGDCLSWEKVVLLPFYFFGPKSGWGPAGQ